jgi:rod shape-determining protein MreC
MFNLLKKTYLYIGIIFLVALIAHYRGWLQPIESIIQSFLSPSFTNTHTLSVQVGDSYHFFKNRADFLQAYQECSLQQQNKEVVEVNNTLLKKENEELKKQLNFISKNKIASITTDVIGKDFVGVQKIIIINAGAQEGVKIDDPVIVGNGILIGKIMKVDEHISMARLINDTQSKIEASVLNNDQTIGIVEGGYGVSLRMVFVPRNEIISIDDQIITSGFEKNLPRGLLIGRAAAIENEAYQGFQTITIAPPMNLSKLTTVTVLFTN